MRRREIGKARSISPLGSLTCGFGERRLSRPGGAAGCRNQGLADSLSSLSCPDTSSARSLARRGLRFQKSPPHWALQDIVNIWFEGPQQRACQALRVSRAVLWRQMTGRDVVSRPMVRRMLLLTADEKERARRAREALEAADREAEIVLVRHAIDKLAAQRAVQASGNSGSTGRKRSAA